MNRIFNRNDRKVQTVWFACGRVCIRRTGRAAATAEKIRADDEVFVGVDELPRSDHHIPPTGFAVIGAVIAGHMSIPAECVADQNSIVLLLIELAIGLVCDINRPKILAALKAQRGVRLNNPNRLRLNDTDRIFQFMFHRGAIIGDLSGGFNWCFNFF